MVKNNIMLVRTRRKPQKTSVMNEAARIDEALKAKRCGVNKEVEPAETADPDTDKIKTAEPAKPVEIKYRMEIPDDIHVYDEDEDDLVDSIDSLKNIVILYTFDPIDDDKNYEDNIIMLKYSILSVFREIPEADIRVYTSDIEIMREELEKYPVTLYRCKDSYLRGDMKTFSKIGHGRVFIIPDILDQGKSVVYMDNDTKFNWNSRKSLINFFLKNRSSPACWSAESHMTTHEWCNKFEIDPYHIGIVHGHNFNNGLLYFPNSQYSREVAGFILGTYENLYTKYGYSYGLDQIALNKIFYENKCYSKLCSVHGNPFFHYYIEKKHHLDTYMRNRIKYIEKLYRAGAYKKNIYLLIQDVIRN